MSWRDIYMYVPTLSSEMFSTWGSVQGNDPEIIKSSTIINRHHSCNAPHDQQIQLLVSNFGLKGSGIELKYRRYSLLYDSVIE